MADLPDTPDSPEPPPPSSRLRLSLRERLPELLLEIVSVVFAVLLALGVNEWRERQADADLAARARQTVLEEIRGNRTELLEALEDHEALSVQLQEDLARLDDPGLSGESSFEVDYSLPDLSAAAWEAATVTEAIHHLDFEWVARVAAVYNLQQLHAEAQSRFLDVLSSIGEADEEGPPRRWLRALQGRLGVLVGLEEGLLESQARILGSDSGSAAAPDR